MTYESHVTCDPIPRVKYIWIRTTLTELVEINNNKRVLGPSQWKTITLKHTFPFSCQWFLVRDVFFFCTSNVFEGINAKFQYPLKIVDLPTLQNDVHCACIRCFMNFAFNAIMIFWGCAESWRNYIGGINHITKGCLHIQPDRATQRPHTHSLYTFFLNFTPPPPCKIPKTQELANK